MKKSGLADSPFFAPVPKSEPAPPPQAVTDITSERAATPPPVETPIQNEIVEKIKKPKKQKSEQPINRDTTIPRNQDTMPSSYQEPMLPRVHGVVIDLVRKAVKEYGKEAATHRFTVAEKKELADLIYTYGNRDIRTSENEITRIAVNFIMQDYKENGENSVLHKIITALNE